MNRKFYYTIGMLLAMSLQLQAHQEGHGGGMTSGFLHPMLGPDHFLAMLCVGILSAQQGGKAIYLYPMNFVLNMAFGGVLGILGTTLPAFELGIALSVIFLGVAVGYHSKVPVLVSILFVSFFGILHGYAHGVEMPGISSPYQYVIGFMLGTSLIHLLGVFGGTLFLKSSKRVWLFRSCGTLFMLIGFVMSFQRI